MMTILAGMTNMQAKHCVKMVAPGTVAIGAIDASGNGRMESNEAVLRA